MTTPALAVHGLTFQYASGSAPALRDVDMHLDPGELLLVAGPSGCGKSTLLKCLNGLIPRSYQGTLSGEVQLFGRSAAPMALQEISRRVGTVLQDPDKQLVAATVRNDVAFGLENAGVPRREIERRIDEVATELSLGQIMTRSTAALSGGERQKVALAGVLAMRPDVMLLDEPLASLDPATALELLGFLRAQTREGLAVIVVEHRVEDVLDINPDRVVYMDRGGIQYQGNVQGFLRVADPAAVKLPFDAVLERFARDGSGPVVDHGALSRPGAAPVVDALVTYRDATYAYSSDQPPAVRGVSTELCSPQRVAVLGPNGSGKSTLMKLVLGLLRPTRGSVEVGGKNTTEQTVAQLARQVAYVFQSPRQMLFANTVREELAFAPRNLGAGRADAESLARMALHVVGLDQVDGIWDRSPFALSFGQQKRLAIAVALTMRPRAIILDEPSAGQDYGQASEFLQEIGAMEGLESVYYITHDVDLALLFSDRCLLMRLGGLEAQGAPLQALADRGRLEAFRLRPTSLLDANLRLRGATDRPLDARALAAWQLQKSR